MWTRAMPTLRMVRPMAAGVVAAHPSMSAASWTARRTMESEGPVIVQPYDDEASGVPPMEHIKYGYPGR